VGVPWENRLTQQQLIIISLIDNSSSYFFLFLVEIERAISRAAAAHIRINDDDLSS